MLFFISLSFLFHFLKFYCGRVDLQCCNNCCFYFSYFSLKSLTRNLSFFLPFKNGFMVLYTMDTMSCSPFHYFQISFLLPASFVFFFSFWYSFYKSLNTLSISDHSFPIRPLISTFLSTLRFWFGSHSETCIYISTFKFPKDS